jgi:hypothetical protein
MYILLKNTTYTGFKPTISCTVGGDDDHQGDQIGRIVRLFSFGRFSKITKVVPKFVATFIHGKSYMYNNLNKNVFLGDFGTHLSSHPDDHYTHHAAMSLMLHCNCM